MTQENLDQLIRIYNTMLLIGTKGEDTLLMGQCLGAMKEEIEKLQQALISANNDNVIIEDIKE